MTRFAPAVVLVLVTTLLAGYGRFSWSWAIGPIAALALWSLERRAHKPAAPAAARTPGHAPAPVD